MGPREAAVVVAVVAVVLSTRVSVVSIIVYAGMTQPGSEGQFHSSVLTFAPMRLNLQFDWLCNLIGEKPN